MKVKIEIHRIATWPTFYNEHDYKAYTPPSPSLERTFSSFQELQQVLKEELDYDTPCKNGFFKIFFDQHCVFEGNHFDDTYHYKNIEDILEPIIDFLERFSFLVQEDLTIKDYYEDDEDDAN